MTARTARTTQASRQTALDAYIAAQLKAQALIKTLTAQLDAHQDAQSPDAIHWGHVGDITSIVAQLSAIMCKE